MFKLLTIVVLLAPVPTLADDYDWRETIRRGAQDMDRRNEAARRELHDMNMESHALHQEIEMHNQSITQEGIRDQMMLNGQNPYWR